MPIFNDHSMGNHQGWRRRYVFDGLALDITNAGIAAGAVESTQALYAPSFVDFMGVFLATTAVSTTVEVRVQPIQENNSGVGFTDDEFTVASITTGAPGPLRYPFYWGRARGLLTGTLFGATYCFSAAFRIRIRNTGGNAMTLVTTEFLECL